MNYELAKLLNDSGFPQSSEYQWVKYMDGSTELVCSHDRSMKPQMKTLIAAPTLSELIEACEDNFFAISHWPEGWTAEGGLVIQHGASNDFTAQVQCKNLPTAEEAVAKLWLALHSTSAANRP